MAQSYIKQIYLLENNHARPFQLHFIIHQGNILLLSTN